MSNTFVPFSGKGNISVADCVPLIQPTQCNFDQSHYITFLLLYVQYKDWLLLAYCTDCAYIRGKLASSSTHKPFNCFITPSAHTKFTYTLPVWIKFCRIRPDFRIHMQGENWYDHHHSLWNENSFYCDIITSNTIRPAVKYNADATTNT